MSIPLDRLYHYIESVAQDVYGDTVIYRFAPHGSKKIEDLGFLEEDKINWVLEQTLPQIYCHDQEPLNFDLYQTLSLDQLQIHPEFKTCLPNVSLIQNNIRSVYAGTLNIYDQCILLHSEQRSYNVELYQQHNYLPVYYWNHAILARDWFRYAEHIVNNKQAQTKPFLIYNRAWSGTREYRLKFADLLIQNNLVNDCRTSIGFIDNQIHYKNHNFLNLQWKPTTHLEDYYNSNTTTSCYSADFEINDYDSTDIEIVLETLFDDSRLHLTEKSLRPIAVGQPFILCATHGSLEYLRTYGFKTFNEVFDESYDTIVDPMERLNSIVKLMSDIKSWDTHTKFVKLKQLHQIAEYNKRHFFSNYFFTLVNKELKTNLQFALNTLEKSNTSMRYINLRKKLAKYPALAQFITSASPRKTRQDIATVIKKATNYYNKYRNKY